MWRMPDVGLPEVLPQGAYRTILYANNTLSKEKEHASSSTDLAKGDSYDHLRRGGNPEMTGIHGIGKKLCKAIAAAAAAAGSGEDLRRAPRPPAVEEEGEGGDEAAGHAQGGTRAGGGRKDAKRRGNDAKPPSFEVDLDSEEDEGESEGEGAGESPRPNAKGTAKAKAKAKTKPLPKVALGPRIPGGGRAGPEQEGVLKAEDRMQILDRTSMPKTLKESYENLEQQVPTGEKNQMHVKDVYTAMEKRVKALKSASDQDSLSEKEHLGIASTHLKLVFSILKAFSDLSSYDEQGQRQQGKRPTAQKKKAEEDFDNGMLKARNTVTSVEAGKEVPGQLLNWLPQKVYARYKLMMAHECVEQNDVYGAVEWLTDAAERIKEEDESSEEEERPVNERCRVHYKFFMKERLNYIENQLKD